MPQSIERESLEKGVDAPMETPPTYPRGRVVAVIVVAFALISFMGVLIERIFGTSVNDQVQLWIVYALQIAISVGAALTINSGRMGFALSDLGLKDNFLSGLKMAALFTAPMLIGYLIFLPFSTDVTAERLLQGAVMAAIIEELAFRGVLFGLLFKRAKMGFLPAALLVSLLFGLGHIFQGNSVGEAAGVFAVTFLGGGIAAYLYVEWNFNLWLVIFTHLLMNFYWELFLTEEGSAVGNNYANIFRLVSVLLIVIMTILKVRKDGTQLKRRLWRIQE